MNQTNSILKLRLRPKDREIALGLLIGQGVTTLEEKKVGSALEFRIQIPEKQSTRAFLKVLTKAESTWETPIFLKKEVHQIKDNSWIHEYQKYLKPFSLPCPALAKTWKPLQIDPRASIPKNSKPNTLFIRANLAFGTGTHPSTFLASQLLQEVLFQYPNSNVLDVGTGTGILAMIACRRGASEVWAVERDLEALQVAKENFNKNHFPEIVLKPSIIKVRKKFFLIVANIIASELQTLYPDLLRKIRKEGHLLLSGLTYRDVAELLRHYQDFELVKRINRRGWSAVWLQKKNKVQGP